MALNYFFCWTILSVTTGLYVPQITLEDYSNSRTDCKEGLVGTLDMYTLSAQINEKQEMFIGRNNIQFEILEHGISNYRMICYLRFDKECKGETSKGCYCKGYENGAFKFQVNKTADVRESRGIIRVKWASSGSEKDSYSNSVSLPVIYSNEKEMLLTGKRENDLSKCDVLIFNGEILSWCVYNLLSHTVAMDFPTGTAASQTDCVKMAIYYTKSSHIEFNVSYQERSGCLRRGFHRCQGKILFEADIIRRPRSENGCNTLLYREWMNLMIVSFAIGLWF